VWRLEFCRKAKYIWCSHFPEVIRQTFWLETTSLCLNKRLSDKKSPHSHYFYCNLGIRLTFMCSPANDKFNLSYSRTQHSRKRQLLTWFLYFNWYSFFAFWGPEKQLFHNTPFSSTNNVLKSFGCLEVSNRVSNWKKSKNLILVGSILQICQLEIPVFI